MLHKCYEDIQNKVNSEITQSRELILGYDENTDPATAREIIQKLLMTVDTLSESMSLITEFVSNVLKEMDRTVIDENTGSFKEANIFKLQFKNIRAYVELAKYIKSQIKYLSGRISYLG